MDIARWLPRRRIAAYFKSKEVYMAAGVRDAVGRYAVAEQDIAPDTKNNIGWLRNTHLTLSRAGNALERNFACAGFSVIYMEKGGSAEEFDRTETKLFRQVLT